ncbi:hypothetical protein BaOVIS_021650 [Babesia ovis]|uniref:RRM domain-containing protein n=1 Tax=Babesia ovis TaxID=5869 RepID=A0A9W5WVB1_BABOV|nr:hypothetical protein BaOVIS_021650 [Babesia ovis]
MTKHGHPSDDVVVIHDASSIPSVFPGSIDSHGSSLHQISSDSMSLPPHSTARSYHKSKYNGKVTAAWRPRNSNARGYGAPYRPPTSDSRVRRGRSSKSHHGKPIRVALYVAHATGDYRLVESDLRELFSYFGGISKLEIHSSYAAAELTLLDSAGATSAIAELNGLSISGVGTLRCTELRNGQTLETVLLRTKSADHKRGSRSTDAANPHSDSRHAVSSSHKAALSMVARLELVDMFAFEPEFDVAATLLGPKNGNIEYVLRNSGGVVDIAIRGKPLNSAPPSERLHVYLSSRDSVSYTKALHMLEDLVASVCEKFVSFARSRGKRVSNFVGFKRHEYQDVNGSLEYRGVTERPKTWLQKRSSGVVQPVPSVSHRSSFKRAHDRHRGVNHKSGGHPKFGYRSMNRVNHVVS